MASFEPPSATARLAKVASASWDFAVCLFDVVDVAGLLG